MSDQPVQRTATASAVAERMWSLCARLYPICRSITGNGVRESLAVVAENIPLNIVEVPTGTPVFDWTVPEEWNIESARIYDGSGKVLVDFADNNLHVLNYSEPVDRIVSFEELDAHLHSLPEQPELIPYRTSYYDRNWGFCVSQNFRDSLNRQEDYRVEINSSLRAGSLTYGECLLPGASQQEILVSAHICHPSLANDNLSGMAVASELVRWLQQRGDTRFSYRFVFIPGTIGSITWLARNQQQAKQIRGGLVASLLGDDHQFTYKRSRRGNTEMDYAVEAVLEASGHAHEIREFMPYGYDERQFCSPAFDLAVGNLTRRSFGEYPEYHTSADNLDFLSVCALEESLQVYQSVIEHFESARFYRNTEPYCEPQLGRRGLYEAIGGSNDARELQLAMLWLLNLSCGYTSVAAIQSRSGLSAALLDNAAQLLLDKGLLVDAVD